MNSNFNQFLNEIETDKKFSLDQLKLLIELFNDRFWRALNTIIEKGVKKYIFIPSNRIIWIVVGKKKDYLILSDLYCPCEDFYLNVVIRKTSKMCYHLISKILADKLDYYEEIKVEDKRFDELMKDWKQI